jgi:GAF domain-containing protein
VSDSKSPFNPRQASAAIAQSIETRESSRVQRLHRTLQALRDTTRVNPPASGAAVDQLLGSILDAVMIASEADMGNIQLLDPAAETLRIRVHRGFPPEFIQFFNHVHHGAYSCGTALAQGRPVVVDDVGNSPLFGGESLRQMMFAQIKACQSVALINDGRRFGVLSVHYRAAGIPQRSRETFASTAGMIAEIAGAAIDPNQNRSMRPW